MMHRCSAISVVRVTVAALVLALSACGLNVSAQTTPATIQFDSASKVFRIDAADSTYAFGINEVQGLQNLYWGKHLAAIDHFAAAHSTSADSSFEPHVTVTPQEYVGWGGGLYVDPDLKITFPDGNRDLALKYVSHHIDGDRSIHRDERHLARGVCHA